MTTEDKHELGTEPKAIELVLAEVVRARNKHGASMETKPPDARCRILMEEVGEVARALNEIEHAEERRDLAAPTATTPQLEALRAEVTAARTHVLEELVQVSASALRWAAAEMATASQRMKLLWNADPDEWSRQVIERSAKGQPSAEPPEPPARDLHHSQGVIVSEVIAAAEKDRLESRKPVTIDGTFGVVSEDFIDVVPEGVKVSKNESVRITRVRVREPYAKASIYLKDSEVTQLIRALQDAIWTGEFTVLPPAEHHFRRCPECASNKSSRLCHSCVYNRDLIEKLSRDNDPARSGRLLEVAVLDRAVLWRQGRDRNIVGTAPAGGQRSATGVALIDAVDRLLRFMP